jgi:hypothetical protein
MSDDLTPPSAPFPPAAPDAPAVIEELRAASAARKGEIQRKLGEASAVRPPGVSRAARNAPPAPARGRNGIFDAPDADTQKVRAAAVEVRRRLAEIARAIGQAEQICPKHMAILEAPGAPAIASRTEDFDVEAAARFLADARALLDSYKPVQG